MTQRPTKPQPRSSGEPTAEPPSLRLPNADALETTFDGALRRIGAAPLLIVFALLMLLPGFASLPPMDRDEPRFAQASKQMLESGDFVDIRFGEEARNKKPVGIYWMQAAAVALGERAGIEDARRQIWLYRLPSLLGALACVLLTAWAALPFLSRRGAILAGLLLAATPLVGVEARLATTDAVVAATVAAAMGVLARAYLARQGPGRISFELAAMFWLSLGIGIMVKGPVTPLVPILAALVLSLQARSARWLLALRPLAGLLLCLALVLPWFVLILLRTHGGFLSDAVGHDLLDKVAGAQEMHGAPPGAYFAAFWLTGWPIAPFAALAAPALWRWRGDPRVLFLLAWIVPAWLLFEAVPTKLTHYVLPLYPALAILALFGLERAVPRAAAAGARAFGGWLLFGLLALVPLAALALAFGADGRLWTLDPGFAALGVGATLIALFLAWSACRALKPGRPTGAVLLAAFTPLPIYLWVFGGLLTPALAPKLAVSPRLAAAARAALAPACSDPLFATVGDREPSLMFETDTRLRMTDAAGAAQFLGAGGCRAAFVIQRDDAAFQAALPSGTPVTLAARVGGIAINGGHPLDIGVYIRQ